MAYLYEGIGIIIKMNPKVSVIIPVYNTAQYLNKCVQSVCNQTLNDWEMILVDDGAKDESPQICDEWAQKDERIHVIHKENEGLGLTRNAGLKIAKGEFVCFLDSDDTIDEETLEYCVDKLINEQADACFYGRKSQGKDGKYVVNHKIPLKLVFSGDEVKNEYAKIYVGYLADEESTSYIQASACCAMYRRQIIEEHNITFMSERVCLSEDTFFNLDFCNYARKVLIIPMDFYNYTYNCNSLTKSYNPNKINQVKLYIKYLWNYKDMYSDMDRVEKRIAYSFYICFRHVVEYEIKAWEINGFVKTYKRIRELCKDNELIEQLKNISLDELDSKKRLFVWLFLHKQALLLILYYLVK